MNSVSHGVRVLAKRPGFTAAAVLVLALGIGANAAIFSLVNAFLLKPLAVHNPEELVGLYSRDARKPDKYRAFSYPNFVDLRGQAGVFTSLAAHNLAMVGLTEGDTTRRLFADLVSSNYFDTMGVRLFRGRVFTAEEERPGSAMPVVIVSYSFWKRHGADAAMLGRHTAPQWPLVYRDRHTAGGFHRHHGPDQRRNLCAARRLRSDGQRFRKPRPCAGGSRDNHALIAVGAFAPRRHSCRGGRATCRSGRGDAKGLAGGEQRSDAIGAPASRLNVSTSAIFGRRTWRCPPFCFCPWRRWFC